MVEVMGKDNLLDQRWSVLSKKTSESGTSDIIEDNSINDPDIEKLAKKSIDTETLLTNLDHIIKKGAKGKVTQGNVHHAKLPDYKKPLFTQGNNWLQHEKILTDIFGKFDGLSEKQKSQIVLESLGNEIRPIASALEINDFSG